MRLMTHMGRMTCSGQDRCRNGSGAAGERYGVVRPGLVLLGTVVTRPGTSGRGCHFAVSGFRGLKQPHRLKLLLGHNATGMGLNDAHPRKVRAACCLEAFGAGKTGRTCEASLSLLPTALRTRRISVLNASLSSSPPETATLAY
jgi:hypothetical protein